MTFRISPGVSVYEYDVSYIVPPVTPRFIQSLEINGKWSLIISNVRYWMANEVELENYIIENNAEREGTVLYFKTKEERTWFLLRWGG